MVLEIERDGCVVNDDGGKFERVDTDQFPISVGAHELEGKGPNVGAPFVIPPEAACDGETPCSIQATVTMGLAIFNSVDQVSNWAAVRDGGVG